MKGINSVTPCYAWQDNHDLVQGTVKTKLLYSNPPIYRVPWYTVPDNLPPISGFTIKPVLTLPRFTGSPDIPCIFAFPQEAR